MCFDSIFKRKKKKFKFEVKNVHGYLIIYMLQQHSKYVILVLMSVFSLLTLLSGSEVMNPEIKCNKILLEKNISYYPVPYCKVTGKIKEIPPENYVSSTKISTVLNKSKLGIIKFYHQDDDLKLINCYNCEKKLQ